MSTAPNPTRKGPSPLLVGTGVLVLAVVFLAPRLQWDSVGTTVESMPKPEAQVEAGQPNFSASAIRLGVAFVVVFGLCVVVAKMLRPRAAPVGAGVVAEAALALDHRSTLYFVKAGNRRLVMGVDAAGVKGLVELTPVPEKQPEPEITAVSPQLLVETLNRLREVRTAA